MGNKRYWIFVTNEENYIIIKNKEIYGFNERTKRDIEKLKTGDFVIIYIKGKFLGGSFEIVSLDEKNRNELKDYPYKIKLRQKFVPNKKTEFKKELINKISIFKNKKRWGTILMGKSTKEITKKDYNYLKEALN